MKVDLPGVRHAEQTDVGQHPQLEAHHAALAGLAVGFLTRRAVRTGFEMQVAETARAALRDLHALVVLGQVGDQLAGFHIGNGRADRHAQRDIVAALAVAVRATAVFAVARQMFFRVAVVDQRVDVAVCDRDHAAAPAAVAAIRAAERNEFLAAHRRAAIPSVAGDDFNPRFVNELHA